jgi:hypothetical protein
MRILNFGGIPTSLGEIINIKYHLDLVKNKYDQIILSFHTPLWEGSLHTEASDWEVKKKLWMNLLSDLGKLFFSEKPYILEDSSNRYGGDVSVLVRAINLPPTKAEMGHLLCCGNALNLQEPYIVLTTKARQFDRGIFNQCSKQFWDTLLNLSKKYKIVILGEREVEMRKEYHGDINSFFGLYNDIISLIPKNRLIDLTVPALGETVSNLKQIQQDCLIMKEAKFVITLGVGGNFCMATAVADMAIGFRTDNLGFTDYIYNSREYPNAIITKDWSKFIRTLSSYL